MVRGHHGVHVCLIRLRLRLLHIDRKGLLLVRRSRRPAQSLLEQLLHQVGRLLLHCLQWLHLLRKARVAAVLQVLLLLLHRLLLLLLLLLVLLLLLLLICLLRLLDGLRDEVVGYVGLLHLCLFDRVQ